MSKTCYISRVILSCNITVMKEELTILGCKNITLTLYSGRCQSWHKPERDWRRQRQTEADEDKQPFWPKLFRCWSVLSSRSHLALLLLGQCRVFNWRLDVGCSVVRCSSGAPRYFWLQDWQYLTWASSYIIS